MSLVLEHDNFEEHMKILADQGVVVNTENPLFTKDRGTGEPVKIFRAYSMGNFDSRPSFVCFTDDSSSYYPVEDKSNFFKSYDISYTDRYFWENQFRIKRIERLAGLPELVGGLFWEVKVWFTDGGNDPRLTLLVVDAKGRVVSRSLSVALPMDEEVFLSELNGLSKSLSIPNYNPFELNP